MIRIKAVLLLVVSLACAAAAFGQSTATITGTVHDSTGAVVRRAVVHVRNVETGLMRAAQSNDEGDYTLTNLAIGSYDVSIEVAGFKKLTRGPISLAVDQVARIDLALALGESSESVTVSGGTPLIETEQSSIGQVIGNKTIVELPLNGRNFLQLGGLIPGATNGAPGNTTIVSREGGAALTVNGQRAEYNNYLLDGMDNNELNLGLVVFVPSIDAIQEFKVQTANYSAQYGRASGAIVEAATKAGTNSFHGTAYDFVRNQIFDAKNEFSPVNNPLHRNQFGFSIGGPVRIPHVYDGRNRTFFFFNSEWLRLRQGFTGAYVVPTVAQRGGDFTGLATIYDPLNVVAGLRQPFSLNKIPVGRLNPIAQAVIASFPLPNNADPTRNYLVGQSAPTNSNQQTLRIDQTLSSKDQLFLRFSKSDSSQDTPALPYNGFTILNHPRGFVVGYTRIVSSKMVNDVRIGAQQYKFVDVPDSFGTDYPTQLGLPTYGATPALLQYPGISISNLSVLSGQSNLPVLRAENTFQYSDLLTINAGRHALTVGGDFRPYQYSNNGPQTLSGAYTFTGVFTGQVGSAYTNGLADFLLGSPVQEQILNGTGYESSYIRNKRAELFVQDDFEVQPRLTLNLGLRWERDGDWTEKHNRWGYFDANTGQVVYPQNAQTSFTTFPYPYRFDDINAIKHAQNLAFSPRAGFAYRPSKNDSMVVRGAYGLFQGQPTVNPVASTTSAPPFFLRQTVTSGSTTPALTFGVFPSVTANSLLPTLPAFTSIDPRTYRNAYIQQWNLGVEKQMFGDYAFKISYVGSKGTHLDVRSEANPAYPPGPGAVQARRRYPLIGAILLSTATAWTNYQSLQASAEKHMSHGLEFLTAYTYSKSLDSASEWGGLSNENSIAQNPYNMAGEYGRSATDLRHRLTISAVYLTPALSHSRLLDTIAGRWQVSGLLLLQTGFPFTVTVPSDIANIGQTTVSERANQIGDPRLAHPSSAQWFSKAAFALPAPYTFGSAGRNTLSGPGTRSLDMSLSKFFPIYKENRLQFRAEFFNLPNHPNLGLPNHSFGDPAFATIQSADNRVGQLALKYIF